MGVEVMPMILTLMHAKCIRFGPLALVDYSMSAPLA
jgi:hypothetical protein